MWKLLWGQWRVHCRWNFWALDCPLPAEGTGRGLSFSKDAKSSKTLMGKFGGHLAGAPGMTMSIPLSGGACLLSVFVSLSVSFVWGYISSSTLCLCLCPVYRDFLSVCFCLLFQLSLSFFFSYSLSSLSLSLMCTPPLSLFSCIGSCSLSY